MAVAAIAAVALTGGTALHGGGGGGSIYAIGDSWAAGLHADPAHALVQDAADDLGMTATVDGESGSGYLAAPGGTSTYPERAAAIPTGTSADIALVQGGSNDDRQDLTRLPAAVAATVDSVRAALPGARVVLLGPGPDPWPVTATQTRVDRILAVEAARLGVQYISPLQRGWFTASDVDTIIDPATHHPTVEGDRILGGLLADALRGHGHGRPHRPPASVLPAAAAALRRAAR